MDKGIVTFANWMTLICVVAALWISVAMAVEGPGFCICKKVTCGVGGGFAITFLVIAWLYVKLPAFVAWRNR